jgi:transposase
MRRFEMTSKEWGRVKARMLLERSEHLVDEDRAFINAVLYIARTNAPWQFLPPRYGDFEKVLERFLSWRDERRWRIVFDVVDLAAEDQVFVLSEGEGCEELGVR